MHVYLLTSLLICMTYVEMGIHMLESILRIRCMVLEYTTLEMVIAMKEPGMRERGKDLAFTLSETVKLSLVTGRMEF